MIEFARQERFSDPEGIRIWLGEPRYREVPGDSNESPDTIERDHDAIVREDDVNRFVIEWLRGPRGHTGAVGTTGARGPAGHDSNPLIGG